MRTTTIKELGQQLPIGKLIDGKLNKEFKIRPYKNWVDRQLNIWLEANENARIANLAAKFVSLIVETMYGEAFPLIDKATGEKDSTPETLLKVHQAFSGDIFYIYLYSRIINVSNQIVVPYRCPLCGAVGTATADLWNTEVKVIESPAELGKWVELRDGFKLASGQLCKKILVSPVPYLAQLFVGSGQADLGAASYNILREAIKEVDGSHGPYILQDSELDEIGKVDMLIIERNATTLSAGPDLKTSIQCPSKKCGAPIVDPLNWRLDSFFGHSVPLEILTI